MKAEVASYVARLPMPAPDAKTWLESVTVDATPVQHDQNTDDKSESYPCIVDQISTKGEPE
jgi:hypothetical protein